MWKGEEWVGGESADRDKNWGGGRGICWKGSLPGSRTSKEGGRSDSKERAIDEGNGEEENCPRWRERKEGRVWTLTKKYLFKRRRDS